MKFTAASAAAIMAAIPSALAQAQGFTLMSLRSASPIHFGSITANGGAFWIGKPTSSYCPSEVVPNCPTNPGTAFVGGDGTVSLDVTVPGGQQVYVAPTGVLTWTAPHSAYIPAGSVRDGFYKTPGASFDTFSFDGGLVACPTGNADTEGFPYQIYGQIPGVTLPANCLGFSAIASNYTGEVAWEY